MQTNHKIAVSCAASLAVIAPALYLAWKTAEWRPRAVASGVEFPNLWDFPLGLLGSVAVTVVRAAVTPFFEAMGRRALSEKNAKIEDRVQRFGVVTFKTIFYAFITVVGYVLLRDEPWFPRELGGSGDADFAISGWPRHQVSDQLRLYVLVQLAYKFHELLYLLAFGMQRNDWFEMSVHHTCTLLLMAFANALNVYRMAALVLFVHDASDISTYAIKVVVDTDWKAATGVLFVKVLASWGWARLYVFPAVIIRSVLRMAPDYSVQAVGTALPAYSLVALLALLLALHCYWFCLIVQMGFNAVRSGKAQDTYQRKVQ